MFSRIIREGNFVLSNRVRSSYDYDYSSLSDDMSAAYCVMLLAKLESWQKIHGRFNVIVGTETEGIRIGYQLSKQLNLPFHIMPKKSIDFAQLEVPAYPKEAHWLIVDDIVTTGSTFLRAVDQLEIKERPESVTFACMIKRNLENLDYSEVSGNFAKSHYHVRDERFDFIDKRLVALFSESQGIPG